MKLLKLFIFLSFIVTQSLFSFTIDTFNPKASLTENFSTNCLQMTQSQQILKTYVMVGLNSSFQNPKETLKKAVVDYDKRAHQMHDYFHNLLGDKNVKARASFDEALKLWESSKTMLETVPNEKNALKLRENLQTMITKLLEGTKPLATPDLELISLTGKLCRKPIEITIDYLMRIWGIHIEGYDKDIKKIIKNYHTNLDTLLTNKLNNKESKALLSKSRKQFMFFEFMYNAKSRFIPNLLSKKADDNFLIIRSIKKIYKKQAEKDI